MPTGLGAETELAMPSDLAVVRTGCHPRRVLPPWLFSDLDGTLADNLCAAVEAYRRFAERAGFIPSDREFGELIGPSIPEIVTILRARHDLKRPEAELVGAYRACWDACQEVAPAKEGAVELLLQVKGSGAKTAVVTSGPRRAAQRFLERVGLLTHVAMIVSGDDVAQSKPDPAIYRFALVAARCAASDVIALEDSVNGVRSAVGAGLSTVAIVDSRFGATPDALRSAGASRVILRLTDLFA